MRTTILLEPTIYYLDKYFATRFRLSCRTLMFAVRSHSFQPRTMKFGVPPLLRCANVLGYSNFKIQNVLERGWTTCPKLISDLDLGSLEIWGHWGKTNPFANFFQIHPFTSDIITFSTSFGSMTSVLTFMAFWGHWGRICHFSPFF